MSIFDKFMKWLAVNTVGKENLKMKQNVDILLFRNGKVVAERHIRNLVTTAGKGKASGLLNGATSTAFTYLAVGTGTVAPDADDTTLGTEITDSGLARASATCTQTTTSTTNDTAQWVKSWSVSGSKAVTESGIFDASSSGNLLARQTFSAINVASGDTLQFTWKVQLS